MNRTPGVYCSSCSTCSQVLSCLWRLLKMSSSLHSRAVILVKRRLTDRGRPEVSETPLADLGPLDCYAANRMWMSGSARTGARTTWSRRRTRAMTPKRWAACPYHMSMSMSCFSVSKLNVCSKGCSRGRCPTHVSRQLADQGRLCELVHIRDTGLADLATGGAVRVADSIVHVQSALLLPCI